MQLKANQPASENPLLRALGDLNNLDNIKSIEGREKAIRAQTQIVINFFDPCIQESIDYLNSPSLKKTKYLPEIGQIQKFINRLNELFTHLKKSRLFDKPNSEQAARLYFFLEIKNNFLNLLNFALNEEITIDTSLHNQDEVFTLKKELDSQNLLNTLQQKYEVCLQMLQLLPIFCTKNFNVEKDKQNQELFLTTNAFLKVQAEVIGRQLIKIVLNLNQKTTDLSRLSITHIERIKAAFVEWIQLRESLRFCTFEFLSSRKRLNKNPHEILSKEEKNILLFPSKNLRSTEAATLAFTEETLEHLSVLFPQLINSDQFIKDIFTFLRISEHYQILGKTIKTVNRENPSPVYAKDEIDKKFIHYLIKELNKNKIEQQSIERCIEFIYIIDTADLIEKPKPLNEKVSLPESSKSGNVDEVDPFGDTLEFSADAVEFSRNTVSVGPIFSELPTLLKKKPFQLLQFYERHRGLYPPDTILQAFQSATNQAQSMIDFIEKYSLKNTSDTIKERLNELKIELKTQNDWAVKTFTRLNLAKQWHCPDEECLKYLLDQDAIEYIRLTNTQAIEFKSEEATDYMYEFELQSKVDSNNIRPQPFYTHIHLEKTLTNCTKLITIGDDNIKAAHIKSMQMRFRGKHWQESQLSQGIGEISIVRKKINAKTINQLALCAKLQPDEAQPSKKKPKGRKLYKK